MADTDELGNAFVASNSSAPPTPAPAPTAPSGSALGNAFVNSNSSAPATPPVTPPVTPAATPAPATTATPAAATNVTPAAATPAAAPVPPAGTTPAAATPAAAPVPPAGTTPPATPATPPPVTPPTGFIDGVKNDIRANAMAEGLGAAAVGLKMADQITKGDNTGAVETGGAYVGLKAATTTAKYVAPKLVTAGADMAANATGLGVKVAGNSLKLLGDTGVLASKAIPVVGSLIGAGISGYQTWQAIKEGNIRRAWYDGIQTLAYGVGTVFPPAQWLGLAMSVGDIASDTPWFGHFLDSDHKGMKGQEEQAAKAKANTEQAKQQAEEQQKQKQAIDAAVAKNVADAAPSWKNAQDLARKLGGPDGAKIAKALSPEAQSALKIDGDDPTTLEKFKVKYPTGGINDGPQWAAFYQKHSSDVGKDIESLAKMLQASPDEMKGVRTAMGRAPVQAAPKLDANGNPLPATPNAPAAQTAKEQQLAADNAKLQKELAETQQREQQELAAMQEKMQNMVQAAVQAEIKPLETQIQTLQRQEAKAQLDLEATKTAVVFKGEVDAAAAHHRSLFHPSTWFHDPGKKDLGRQLTAIEATGGKSPELEQEATAIFKADRSGKPTAQYVGQVADTLEANTQLLKAVEATNGGQSQGVGAMLTQSQSANWQQQGQQQGRRSQAQAAPDANNGMVLQSDGTYAPPAQPAPSGQPQVQPGPQQAAATQTITQTTVIKPAAATAPAPQ